MNEALPLTARHVPRILPRLVVLTCFGAASAFAQTGTRIPASTEFPEPSSRPAGIRGRVVLDHERRSPLRNVEVLAREAGTTGGWLSTTTDASGEYELHLTGGREYDVYARIAYTEPTTGGTRLCENYPGNLSVVDWTVPAVGFTTIPDVVYPQPVFLHSGFNSGWEIWTTQHGHRGMYDFLRAHPTHSWKVGSNGPGGPTPGLPSFIVVRIPNEDQALPGQLGYIQGHPANIFYGPDNHNTNAARFRTHVGRLDLTHYIADASDHRPSIVAHSMGGMISRAMVTTYGNTFDRIACLDTPHGGTTFWNPATPAAFDEQDVNGWWGRFCGPFNCDPYTYTPGWNDSHVDLSTARRWLLYECQGDNVVSPDSSSTSIHSPAFGFGRRHYYTWTIASAGIYVWDGTWQWRQYIGGWPTWHYRVNNEHRENANDPTAAIFRDPARQVEITRWLTDGTSPSPLTGGSQVGFSQPSSAGPDGGTLRLAVAAEAGTSASTRFFPGRVASLDVSAYVEPVGATLAVFDANGRELPIVVTSEVGADRNFTVVLPLTGDAALRGGLDLRVTAPAEEAASVVAVARFQGPARIVTSASAPAIDSREPVTLRAHLEDSLTGEVLVSAGTVVATVRAPGGTVYDVTLYDDGRHDDGVEGDGVFGHVLADTVSAGRYQYFLQGVLENGDAAYERSLRGRFLVRPTGVRIVGQAETRLVDGETARHVVEVPIEVARDGTFRVHATIEDASGQVCGAISRVVEMAADREAQSVRLEIDEAELLRASAGPFVLGRVTVGDSDLGSMTIDEAWIGARLQERD